MNQSPPAADLATILADALERPPAERARYARAACGQDQRLGDEVVDLLRYYGHNDGFLEQLVVTLEPTQPLGAETPPRPAPPTTPRTGRLLAGRYRLGASIAEGGFGIVHRAHDELADTEVAVKLIRGLGPEEMPSVRQETGLLRLLRLPGIVQILDEGEDDGESFLVTELVEGGAFPGGGQPLPWASIADTALDLLAILRRMHWAGVLHRDLKPANVLVDEGGRPIVIDLGLAQERARVGGLAAGTPSYMAPELFREEPATPRTDLYAFGLMLYRALAGELPLTGESPAQLVALRVYCDPPPLASVAPGVPPAVARWVDALIQRDPARRPATAAEAQALLGLTQPALVEARRAEPLLRLLADAEAGAPAGAALEVRELEPLFAGPERLLHRRSDGARELWRRSGGLPPRVVAEVGAWVRAGLASWRAEELVLEQAALERLRGGLRVDLPEVHPDPLPAALQPLLGLIDAAGVHCTEELLRAAHPQPAEALTGELDRLEQGGWIARAPGGRVHVARVPMGWATERGERPRREALAALAQALDDPRARLVFLTAADQRESVPGEALRLARRQLQEGELRVAGELLREGLIAARAREAWDVELDLLEEEVHLAFQHQTPEGSDRALSELGRASRPADPALSCLRDLCQASLLGKRGQPERALELLDGAGALPPRLERWRHSVRIVAHRYRGRLDDEETASQAAIAWARDQADPQLAAVGDSWQGWLHYRRGRFRQAAELHTRAAGRLRLPTRRIDALLGGASAWLEAGDFARAGELAREALAGAQGLRALHYEVRAEWLARSAGLRRGEFQTVDEELVEAAEHVPAPVWAGLICLNEAAVARLGHPEQARDLAERAAARFQRARMETHRALAVALGLAAGADPATVDPTWLEGIAERCPMPAIGLQILALAGRAFPGRLPAWSELARALLEAVSTMDPGERREVLTLEEVRRELVPKD